MFKKKAVSELVSFSFVTLLIIFASTSAYVYSKSQLDANVNSLDRNRMQSYIKSFDAKIDKIISFENSTTSQEVTFRKGVLKFNGNQILYNSLIKFGDNSTNCFNSLCYKGFGGSEVIFKNITSPYVFASNLTLEPGGYIIVLEHDKTNKEIKVTFR